MSTLANLGTAIPMPAFAKCMEATLAVRLGNRWGRAISAQPAAKAVLDGLRQTQWDYYMNECLSRDRSVLDKLANETKPVENWCQIAGQYLKSSSPPKDRFVTELIEVSLKPTPVPQAVMQRAAQLRSRLGM